MCVRADPLAVGDRVANGFDFAPVGVMLRVPDAGFPGQEIEARVVVINDLGTTWSGDVTLSLPDGESATAKGVEVAAYDRSEVSLTVTLPDRHGRHELRAKILGPTPAPFSVVGSSPSTATIRQED